MNEEYSTRFPSMSHIEDLISDRSPSAIAITGNPNCQIRVLPSEHLLEAWIYSDESRPDISRYRFINQRQFTDQEGTWNVLGVTWAHSSSEAYLFLCDVIDRVQLRGESLATATEVVLLGVGSLLRRHASLTRDEEVGLFGELLILNHILSSTSPTLALMAWKGPDSEEHDFALEHLDLEVKTTTSETRAHWISSEHQLRALDGRGLKLLSIQLTPKTGTGSCSLPQMVDHLLTATHEVSGILLDKLEAVGYFQADADLYRTEWALRDDVLAFDVNDTFPKITRRELAGIPLDPDVISGLRYRVNLTTLPHDGSDAWSDINIPELSNE